MTCRALIAVLLLSSVAACERTMVRRGPLASVADSLFPQPVRSECQPNVIELDPSVRMPLDCLRRVGSLLVTVYQDGADGRVTYASVAVVDDSISRRRLFEQMQKSLTTELGVPRRTCDDEDGFGYRGLEWTGGGYFVQLTITPTTKHVLLAYRLGQRGSLPYCEGEDETQRK